MTFDQVGGIAFVALAFLCCLFPYPNVACWPGPSRTTSSLSNFKQTSLAFVMYAQDHNDRYPLANSVDRAKGRQRWNYAVRVPAGWASDGKTDTPARIAEDSLHWANTVQPYLKHLPAPLEIMKLSDIAITDVEGVNYRQATKDRARIGLSFNGLLHSWNARAVGDESRLTLVWAGVFKQNLDGFALTNPVLLCDSATPYDPCQFRPDKPPQSGSTNKKHGAGWWGFAEPGVTTALVYNNGLHMVGTDTGARFVKIFPPTWPSKAMTNDQPWSSLAENGIPVEPYWMIDCVAPGKKKSPEAVMYPGFFRPDSKFDYTEAECDIGNG